MHDIKHNYIYSTPKFKVAADKLIHYSKYFQTLKLFLTRFLLLALNKLFFNMSNGKFLSTERENWLSFYNKD